MRRSGGKRVRGGAAEGGPHQRGASITRGAAVRTEQYGDVQKAHNIENTLKTVKMQQVIFTSSY